LINQYHEYIQKHIGLQSLVFYSASDPLTRTQLNQKIMKMDMQNEVSPTFSPQKDKRSDKFQSELSKCRKLLQALDDETAIPSTSAHKRFIRPRKVGISKNERFLKLTNCQP
jgi:hypothetical protein